MAWVVRRPRDFRNGSKAAVEACPRYVRIPPNTGWIPDIAAGRLGADFVAKLGGTRLARNNRIVGKEFLNRCCSLGAVLESMLPAQAPKIVLQHYLPEADMARTDFGRWVNCSLLNQKRGA